MDFALSDEQIMLRDSVRRMMERHATPDYIRRLDHEQAYPYDLYAAWVEMGLLRLPFPEEYGGAGYSMELDMQRHFRDSRSTTIGAGSSQMQRNLIAGLMGLKVH